MITSQHSTHTHHDARRLPHDFLFPSFGTFGFVSEFWVCYRVVGLYRSITSQNFTHISRCLTLTPRSFRGPIFRGPFFRPNSTVILRKYFKNIPLKSRNIVRIFIKLLERFLKYCRNLSMSAQNIINVMLLKY